MLIVQVREGEKIDRPLKQYKRKFNDTKVARELRDRKEFTKPSVIARRKRLKAKYVQALRNKGEI